jgi:hypothetical protein
MRVNWAALGAPINTRFDRLNASVPSMCETLEARQPVLCKQIKRLALQAALENPPQACLTAHLVT